ncbi:hypothetical protein PFISCL1PPCAC_7061, partial [Pristionchus fissidentatus]
LMTDCNNRRYTKRADSVRFSRRNSDGEANIVGGARQKVRFAKTAIRISRSGDSECEEFELAFSDSEERLSESSYDVMHDISDCESDADVVSQPIDQPSSGTLTLPTDIMLRIIEYVSHEGFSALKLVSRQFYTATHAHLHNRKKRPPIEILRFQGAGKKMTITVDVLSEHGHYFFELKSMNPGGVKFYQKLLKFNYPERSSQFNPPFVIASHKFTVDLTDSEFVAALKRTINTIRHVEVQEMNEEGMRIVKTILEEETQIAHLSLSYRELNQEESERLLCDIRKRNTSRVEIRVVKAAMSDPESFLLRLAEIVPAFGIYQEGKERELIGTNYMFGLKEADWIEIIKKM